MVDPWLLGHLFDDRAGPALDLRPGPGPPSAQWTWASLRPGFLGGVERYVIRRAADRGRARPAVPGRGDLAARRAERAAGGGPSDIRVRPGREDTSRYLSHARAHSGLPHRPGDSSEPADVDRRRAPARAARRAVGAGGG